MAFLLQEAKESAEKANETPGTVSKSLKIKFRINFQDNFKTLNYMPEHFRMLKKTRKIKTLSKSSE